MKQACNNKNTNQHEPSLPTLSFGQLKSNNFWMKTTAKISFTLLLISFVIFSQGCNGLSSNNVVRGDGSVESYIYEVSGFNSIELRGMYNVLLTQGDKEEVFLDIDSNLHELITIEVVDNVLIIRTRRDRIIRPTKIDLQIKFVEIEKIVSAGASKISASNEIKAETLKLDLSGATKINLEMNVNNLYTDASGANNIEFSGKANYHDVQFSGAGKFKADKLHTVSTKINMSGAGAAYVHAGEKLTATMSGVGNLHYAGDPEKKRISRSGIGKVNRIYN